MKKQIFLLMLSACLAFTSCTKNGDPEPEESNTVEIGGATYSTVKIGTQTWTTVNYNGAGGVNYNNGANNAAEGKLYSYTEAVAITGLPTGWRVPTEADVKKLMATLGTETDSDNDLFINEANSKKLIATSGWSINGNNEKGLNIKATGYYFSATNAEFTSKGTAGSFWTSTRDSGDDVLYFEIASDVWTGNTASLRGYIWGTTLDGAPSHPTFVEKRSIRFVKDN